MLSFFLSFSIFIESGFYITKEFTMKTKTRELLQLIKDAKISRLLKICGAVKGYDFYDRCWAERFVKDSSIIIDSGYWSFSPQRREICKQVNTWNPKRYRYHKYQYEYLNW